MPHFLNWINNNFVISSMNRQDIGFVSLQHGMASGLSFCLSWNTLDFRHRYNMYKCECVYVRPEVANYLTRTSIWLLVDHIERMWEPHRLRINSKRHYSSSFIFHKIVFEMFIMALVPNRNTIICSGFSWLVQYITKVFLIWCINFGSLWNFDWINRILLNYCMQLFVIASTNWLDL